MEHSSLPIIDYAAIKGAPEERRRMLAKLGRAARDIGFFYLVGHGLSEAAQRETLALAARFFALPLQEKLAVQMVHSPHFRGYNQVGAELTRARPDLREQFDIMNEEQALPSAQIREPWQRLIGPNQWPAALPEMKTQLLAWQTRLSDITLTLLAAFAEVLAQPAGVFDESIQGAPYQHMKLIHYPGREAGGSGQGVGAHKDPGYLTLVMQDHHSGLEVETADGWISAPPPAGGPGGQHRRAAGACLQRLPQGDPAPGAESAPRSLAPLLRLLYGGETGCHSTVAESLPRAGGAGAGARERPDQPALLSGGGKRAQGQVALPPRRGGAPLCSAAQGAAGADTGLTPSRPQDRGAGAPPFTDFYTRTTTP